jgi:hypothetical protein
MCVCVCLCVCVCVTEIPGPGILTQFRFLPTPWAHPGPRRQAPPFLGDASPAGRRPLARPGQQLFRPTARPSN